MCSSGLIPTVVQYLRTHIVKCLKLCINPVFVHSISAVAAIFKVSGLLLSKHLTVSSFKLSSALNQEKSMKKLCFPTEMFFFPFITEH